MTEKNLPSNHRKTSVSKTVNEEKVIKNLSFVSIAGNAGLSAFKLAAGLLGHSSAMVSDAVHSMSDVFTTVVAYFGVRFSKKPADADHPYGHERIESIASLFLGSILFVTGLGIGKMGLDTILSGDYQHLAVPGLIALIAALLSIVTKEAMYWYTRYYAKLIHSQAFMADAWHHRSDAFSSVGSLIGIGGAMLGFPILDSVASVVICLFILKAAYDIIKTAVSNMMDTSCGAEYEENLKNFILNQEEVEGVDSIKSRSFGNRVYVDLEVAVDGDKTLRQAHQVAETVHDKVEASYPEIKHIMIHVNPACSSQPCEESAAVSAKKTAAA